MQGQYVATNDMIVDNVALGIRTIPFRPDAPQALNYA